MRILALCLLLLTLPAQAAEPFNAEQKKAIEEVVKNYLLTHPEIMREVSTALEKKEGEASLAMQAEALKDYADLLTKTGKHAVIGNPDGDVTLVEFFDYNCGFCRKAEPDLRELIKSDPKLRVVIKEFPVLGDDSIEAALISAQLLNEKKYNDYRSALLSDKGKITKERALTVAKTFGFDVKKLEANMKSDDVKQIIEESYTLANALNINGTPSYVLGKDVLVGAQNLELLKKKIADLRK